MSRIFSWFLGFKAKAYAKGLFSGIFVSAKALQLKYPEIETAQELAIKTLSTRTDMIQIDAQPNMFVLKNCGEGIAVEKSDSLLSVMHKIAAIEAPYLLNDLPEHKQKEALVVIQRELDRLAGHKS